MSSITADGRSVADVIRRHAMERPDARALIFDGHVTTFGELDQIASRIAVGLKALGIEEGGRVAYLGFNSDAFFKMVFGCAKSNCAVVGINRRLAREEIRFILEDSGSEAVVVSAQYLQLVRDIAMEIVAIRTIIVLDGDTLDGVAFDDWVRDHQAIDPCLITTGTETVLQLYTSGTTGRPKGAELHNAAITAGFDLVDQGWRGELKSTDISLLHAPVFHVGGACWGLFPLHVGACNLVLREPDVDQILDAFRDWPVSVLGTLPTILRMIMDHPRCAETSFTDLHSIIYGGSPIPLDLLKAATNVFRCEFVQFYGLTETQGFGTFLSGADHRRADDQLLQSCGRPVGCLDVKIVGPDGIALSAGFSGEIVIRGPVIMKGYWRMPEATEAALLDGWFHTGDVGQMDQDGYLYIRDRLKDMIVSGGENVYPAEIESVLYGCDDIADVAIIGVPHPFWGEAVKAIVVPAQGCKPSEAEIIAYARARLAGFKCPKSVDFVDTLPRNAGGKILKRVLREQYWRDEKRNVG